VTLQDSQVRVTLFLKDFTLDIFFRQWWTDHRLAHGVKKVFNVAANPAEFFWTPDTYFVNVKSSSFHHVTRENTRLMIQPDGKIYYSTRYETSKQGVINGGGQGAVASPS